MRSVIRVSERNVLKTFDIFGVPIHINFNYKNKHTTRFGGFVTLCLYGTLATLIANLVLTMVNKENPQVIQEELIVQTPSRYELGADNFGFAFGILDETYSPFIDETIYKVSAQFMFRVPEIQSDGTTTYSLKGKDIKMAACTKEFFQIKGLEDYFLSLKYDQLYCIHDINDLYFEGQFESNTFSTIEIFISKCSGTGCASEPDILAKIKNQQLQVYYSNNVIKVSDYKTPFQPIGQSAYWNVNLNNEQSISFTYKTAYVNDDVGVIGSDIQTKKNLLFSDNKTLQGTDANKQFFRLSLYLEKNRELAYNRTYTKLIQGISQIGGIYNVLFFIGCMLAQPYSSLELKRKLVNSTFTFPTEKRSDDNNNNDPITTGNQSLLKNSIKESKILCSACNDVFSKNPVKKSKKCTCGNMNKLYQQSQSNKPDYLVENNSPEMKANSPTQNSRANRAKSLMFDKISGGFNKVQELTIRTREYFYYYFKCLRSTDMQNILHFGTDKISEFTDITYIVSKLLELEKLKHLLLNEQQLKLFEYIPKPKISKEIIEMHTDYNIKTNSRSPRLLESNHNNKLLNLINTQNSPTKKERSPKEKESDSLEKKREFNILNLMNRSDADKAIQAQVAYTQIYRNQKKQSKIDLKLLQLLDQNVVNYLNNNTSMDNSILNELAESTINIPRKVTKELKIQSPTFVDPSHKKSIYYELTATDHCLQDKQLTTENQVPENFEVQQIEEVQDPPSKYLKLDRYAALNGFSRPISELISVETTMR